MKIVIFATVLLSALNIFGDVFDDLKIPQKKVKDVRNFADKIIKAGYSDAKDGEFYIGKVQVFSTIDPAKEKPPFPINTSYMQSTGPKGHSMKYGFKFDGPHVKLKNGTWLLELYSPFKEDYKNKIKLANAYPVYPEKIFADAQKKHSFDIKKKAKKWVAGYPTDKKDYLCSIMNKVIPLTFYLRTNSNEAPATLLLLHSAGMKEAPLLAYTIADGRSRNFWQLSYWSKEPGPFDPTGRYYGLKELESKWHRAQSNGYQFEEPDVAFRRALHRMFRHAITHKDQSLHPEIAAKLAKLCTDPKDPQGINKKIDMLLESVKIGEDSGRNMDITEKLRAWGIPKRPEMVVTKGSKGSASISTMFITPVEAYTPNVKDLNQLFKLLVNTRTTKFIDYQGARTVGENSMRAIAIIMRRNPLELVDMAELKPWTKKRRNTAVKKLQKWWNNHRNNYEKYISSKKE